MDQFATAFTDADSVYVLPIYAASEQPVPGVTAERLAERIEGPRVQFVPDFATAIDAVIARAHEGDLIPDAQGRKRQPASSANRRQALLHPVQQNQAPNPTQFVILL